VQTERTGIADVEQQDFVALALEFVGPARQRTADFVANFGDPAGGLNAVFCHRKSSIVLMAEKMSVARVATTPQQSF